MRERVQDSIRHITSSPAGTKVFASGIICTYFCSVHVNDKTWLKIKLTQQLGELPRQHLKHSVMGNYSQTLAAPRHQDPAHIHFSDVLLKQHFSKTKGKLSLTATLTDQRLKSYISLFIHLFSVPALPTLGSQGSPGACPRRRGPKAGSTLDSWPAHRHKDRRPLTPTANSNSA